MGTASSLHTQMLSNQLHRKSAVMNTAKGVEFLVSVLSAGLRDGIH